MKDRNGFSDGAVIIATGAMIALLSGGCTASFLQNLAGSEDEYGFRFIALILGGPVFLLGLALILLGMRGWRRTPPPTSTNRTSA